MSPHHPRQLPLSSAQRGIWLGQRLDRASTMYNAAQRIRIAGGVDVAALTRAVGQATLELDVLRAAIAEGADEAPCWQLDQYAAADISTSVAENETEAECLAARHLARPFDLREAPLCRHLIVSGPTAVDWIPCAHHVALDGLGFALLVQRVAGLYSALSQGTAVPAPRFAPLEDYLREEADYARSEARGADEAFWRGYLQAAPDPVSLGPSAALASGQPLRASFVLDAHDKRALDAAARASRASWPAALTAALAALVAERTSVDEVRLGLPVLGRSRATLRSPAMAMNVVALRLNVDVTRPFATAMAKAKGEMDRVRPHERYRHEQLRRDMGLLGGGRRLFGPVLNIQPFAQTHRFADHQATVHSLSAGPVEDLSVSVLPLGAAGGLALTLEGHPGSYTASDLSECADALHALLRRASHAPDDPVRALSRAHSAAAERAAGDGSWLRGAPLERVAADVMTRLRDHASARSAKVALQRGETRLTYAELHSRVQQVAQRLRDADIRPGDRIAIALPRGIEPLVAILATLEVGASYVPMDPAGPRERNAAVLSDSAPALVIARKADIETLGFSGHVWTPERLRPGVTQAVSAPPSERPLPDAEREAYLLYTSGSTGVPAGVRISRQALSHFAAAAAQAYALGPNDRMIQLAPLHFDTSVEEIFATLGAGATLVLREAEQIDSLSALLQDCERDEVSFLDLPTALWHELVFHLVRSGERLPRCVRVVIIGGEAALPERVRQWHDVVDGPVRLLNTYGPTEATVVATFAELGPLGQNEAVRIGRPLPGTAAAVVTEAGHVALRGQTGELWLMGPNLAAGYLNRPERQQERFIHAKVLDGQPRAYRTGDLVRCSEDGAFEFIGRVDDEVKISGHRIRPAAVESVLLSHPEVREAAVVATHRGPLAARLVAFVVWHGIEDESGEALRAHARRWLAGPAMPSELRCVSRLPRTSTGKIDRRALLAQCQPETAQGEVEDASLCGEVLECLREALGSASLAADANFFDHGGQSLQAIQAANRLSERLGRDVPAALLFGAPSARALAEALSGEADPNLSGTPDDRLLADAWLPDSVRGVGHGANTPAQDVLLTGATGFVGTFLLRALLDDAGVKVTCLVRARSDEHALTRVLSSLRDHGLPADGTDRMQVHATNLAAPRLGLSEANFAQLSRQCDAVLHCAASVSLVRDYASVRTSNVDATRSLLEFACTERSKAFHLVSTLAAATAPDDERVVETVLPHAPALRDGYCESKWVAERMVEAARARGVAATIHRLGRVLGPQAGAVNPQDILIRMLSLGLPRGVMPALEVSEPWVGVDHAASVISAFVRHGECGAIAHNIAPYAPVAFADVLRWAEGCGYRHARCAPDRWVERLGQVPESQRATLTFFEAQAKHGLRPMDWTFETTAFRAAAERHGLPEPAGPRTLFRRSLDAAVERGLLPPPPKHLPGELDAQ